MAKTKIKKISEGKASDAEFFFENGGVDPRRPLHL
jgi:hypothetical protein